jgi:hypothetical protein
MSLPSTNITAVMKAANGIQQSIPTEKKYTFAQHCILTIHNFYTPITQEQNKQKITRAQM